MKELRYLVVPNWVEHAIIRNARDDLQVLLDPKSLFGILSPNDVGFYFAAQNVPFFITKEHEQANPAVHLNNLLGGMFAYHYDETGLPPEKNVDVLCEYINRYDNGYYHLLTSYPRDIERRLADPTYSPDKRPLSVRMRYVNEDVIAIVVDCLPLLAEELLSDRIADNYSAVIEHLRINMSLAEVAQLPLFRSYCTNRSIHYRLRRL